MLDGASIAVLVLVAFVGACLSGMVSLLIGGLGVRQVSRNLALMEDRLSDVQSSLQTEIKRRAGQATQEKRRSAAQSASDLHQEAIDRLNAEAAPGGQFGRAERPIVGRILDRR